MAQEEKSLPFQLKNLMEPEKYPLVEKLKCCRCEHIVKAPKQCESCETLVCSECLTN